MPNIVLSRIDERLIHGQVGVQWVGFAGANLVLVANDEVAEDPVQQNLMEMVLAEGIAVRFWTLQKVIDNIHRAADRQKILLVCKTPADFLTLVKGGVPVNRINVGNMHYANGKQQIITLDLNKAETLLSPYYWLQQNDIVYVTPNKAKARNSDISNSTSIWFSATSILVSLASILVTIFK